MKDYPAKPGWRSGATALERATCLLLLLALAFWATGAFAAEVIPPAPKAFFNDNAGVTRPGTARQLNAELAQFERDTSNQIVVAIYPKMQSASSIEDYTVRIAQAWHVGQKGRNNGAVLFVFVQDRKMFIQVGYGLEGALTDYLCNQIINNELKPRFRAGDFDGGLTAAVHAMMAAAKGEYKGTGKTVAQRHAKQQEGSGLGAVFIILACSVIYVASLFLKGSGGSGRGGGGPIIFGGGGGSGGGGGGGGFDGGGFSGGGGSFGGGGSGGSW